MHFDLRLELDGRPQELAVPKGPSTRVEEKRLAVQSRITHSNYGTSRE